MNKSVSMPIVWLVVSGVILSSVFAISFIKFQEVVSENSRLEGELSKLNAEISSLKETAEFHYQQGINLLSAQNYLDAQSQFETVINKYPSSPYVVFSKTRIAEINKELARIEQQRMADAQSRIEAVMYQPRSDEQALIEWQRFRNNEKASVGTVTTWRLKIKFFVLGCPNGFLNSDTSKMVSILGLHGSSYEDDVLMGKLPEVRIDDWVSVTGSFQFVTKNGAVVLKAIKVVNGGYH